MRILLACLVLAAACGGGKPKSSTTDTTTTTNPDPGTTAAVTPFAREYCDGYSACAEERVRMSIETEGDGQPTDDATVKAQIEAEIDSCHGKTSGLTPEQQVWLQSCTGCGGSCDVYDCMDRIPPEATPAPFECDMGP